MKIKSVITCLMGVLVMALPVAEVSAQTRTASSQRKTASAAKPAAKANLGGTAYIGMATMPGQPIDLWVNVKFIETDASMSMAGAYNFDGKYTATATGSNMNVSIPFNEKMKATLKSADKGGSLEGTLNLNGTNLKLWMVKVPTQLTESNMGAPELEETFGSLDGYTALVKIQKGEGLLCVPADFTTDNSTKTWRMQFDNNAMQEMFGAMQGSYSVADNTVTLTDSKGNVRTFKIYDDGKYLEAPMGSAKGMSLTLILVR